MAYAPGGAVLASGLCDKTVRLWDARTGHLLHTLEGHGDEVRSVAFAPNGAVVASGSSDSSIRFWSTTTYRLLATLLLLPGGRWIIFTPDGYYDGPDDVERQVMMALQYSESDVRLTGGRRNPERVRAALAGHAVAAPQRKTTSLPAAPPQLLSGNNP